MDVGRRKGAAASRTGVVAGSVWESRMKLDEVKGGIKVFNGEENVDNSEGNEEENVGTDHGGAIVPVPVDKKVNLRPRQSPAGTSGKRKTWKSESLEGSPIQIARKRSDVSKNLDEQCRELSMSADGIKKSPIQNKKTRSEATKELSSSVDGIEKSPIQQMMKTRSQSQKLSSDSIDGVEKNSIQLRKLKSESIKALNDNGAEKNSKLRKSKSESIKVPDKPLDGNAKNSLQLVKAKSVPSKNSDENGKSSEGLSNGTEGQLEKEKLIGDSIKSFKEKNPAGIKKTRSDENCKEFGVCEEKVITTNLTKVVQVKSPPKAEETDDFNDADGDQEDWNDELEEAGGEEIDVEIEKKSLVVKEISITEQKPKEVVVEEKKFRHSNERPMSIPSIVKKQSPPLTSHARVHPSPSSKTYPSKSTNLIN